MGTVCDGETFSSEFLTTARELGATAAQVFDAALIVVDERVRLKCNVPVCKNYNVSLMCPPNVMPLNEFRNVLARFQKALIVQIAYDVPDRMLERIHAAEDLATLYTDDAYLKGWDQTYLVAKNTLDTIAARLEADAFKKGLKFATAFSAGKCTALRGVRRCGQSLPQPVQSTTVDGGYGH